MPIPALLPVLPPIPGSGAPYPAISVTGGDGTFWDLSNLDSPLFLMPGHTGFDAPALSVLSSSTPNLPGGAYQGYHDEPRPVFLPLYIEGVDRASAVAWRRALIASIHPSQGLSRICVAEPDGYRRYLDCVYTGGAEGNEGRDSAGMTWVTYGLNFTAFDNPYWYGDVESPTPWTVAAPTPFFPLAPAVFSLASSNVFGGTLVDNAGEVDAYPVWTLLGPATGLTLTLGGRVFSTSTVLTAGQTLTIDTDPRSQTVTDGTGANRWADVSTSQFDLWPLPPGVSTVNVATSGGAASTQLSMSYTPRYLKS